MHRGIRPRAQFGLTQNGITVNGVAVQDAWLKCGDLLKVGRVTFEILSAPRIEGLYQEVLRRLSTIDGPTQVFNRRHLLESLEHEMSRARRYGWPLALLILDIDDFAQCNARYGHRAGDAILGELAELLRERCRKVDLVARLGGDEFAVILPDLELSAAAGFAATIRALIAETKFVFEGLTTFVTVSIEVAALTDADATYKDLLARAVDRLKVAKSSSRDRSVNARWATEDIPPP